eukprot:723371-Hanusia_phi.AAC.1
MLSAAVRLLASMRPPPAHLPPVVAAQLVEQLSSGGDLLSSPPLSSPVLPCPPHLSSPHFCSPLLIFSSRSVLPCLFLPALYLLFSNHVPGSINVVMSPREIVRIATETATCPNSFCSSRSNRLSSASSASPRGSSCAWSSPWLRASRAPSPSGPPCASARASWRWRRREQGTSRDLCGLGPRRAGDAGGSSTSEDGGETDGGGDAEETECSGEGEGGGRREEVRGLLSGLDQALVARSVLTASLPCSRSCFAAASSVGGSEVQQEAHS